MHPIFVPASIDAAGLRTEHKPSTSRKKSANRQSKDGRWRSFSRVPHLHQYVKSRSCFASIKINGIGGVSGSKGDLVWDQEEKRGAARVFRGYCSTGFAEVGRLGHDSEIAAGMVNDGRGSPGSGTDGPTATRTFNLVIVADAAAQMQLHLAPGALAQILNPSRIQRTTSPPLPTPTGRLNP